MLTRDRELGLGEVERRTGGALLLEMFLGEFLEIRKIRT